MQYLGNNTYRLSKYNPIFRDKHGSYQRDDWTSISDIGKTYHDLVLTAEEYLKVESAYLDSFNDLFRCFQIQSLIVKNLEKNDIPFPAQQTHVLLSYPDVTLKIYQKAYDGLVVEIAEALGLARLNLREVLWCTLADKDQKLEIRFGYDYYSYVTCPILPESIIEEIQKRDLFIEVW